MKRWTASAYQNSPAGTRELTDDLMTSPSKGRLADAQLETLL